MGDVTHWDTVPDTAGAMEIRIAFRAPCSSLLGASDCNPQRVTCPECRSEAIRAGLLLAGHPRIGAVVAMVAAGRWAVAERSAIEDIIGGRVSGGAP